ncbi:MAG: hypothetical protein Q4G64_02370 [bacterium]|nr:hypothetical protein [bacterium]
MDERRQLIGGRAAAATLAIAYIYVLVVAFAKFIATKDIENSAFEIIFLVVMPWVFLYFVRSDESAMLPRIGDRDYEDLFTREARRERLIGYVKESAGFAVVLTVLDILANWWTGYREPIDLPEPLIWALVAAITFVIFLGLGYLWGEYQTRRYAATMKELES